MKKRFKIVYLEITNNCNLHCPFCNDIKREKKFINIEDFNKILDYLEPLTDYLYFHVMGEPLLHHDINELINIASERFKINITTNGYLINLIKENKHIRQINISLHSFNNNNGKTLEEYMDNIIRTTNELINNGTYINYRLWEVNNNGDIKNHLINYYHTEIKGNTKINNQVFVSVEKEFIWPSLNNDYYCEKGSCLGTIDHIGVLVDGTVVPCCLDTNGIVNLGNILNDTVDNQRLINMKNNFLNNKKREELCRHCSFYQNK